MHWLNGGEAKPTFVPPRPFEKGVARSPDPGRQRRDPRPRGPHRPLRRRLVAQPSAPPTTRARRLVTVSGGGPAPRRLRDPVGHPAGARSSTPPAAARPASAPCSSAGTSAPGSRRDQSPRSPSAGRLAAGRGRQLRLRRPRRRCPPAPAGWPRRPGSPAGWPARTPASAGRACSASPPSPAPWRPLVRGDRDGTAERAAGSLDSRWSRAGAPASIPTAPPASSRAALQVFADEIARHRAHGPVPADERRSCPSRATARLAMSTAAGRQPDRVRRPRHLRRAVPRADQPRRLGLPDHRSATDPARISRPTPAGRSPPARPWPCSCARMTAPR